MDIDKYYDNLTLSHSGEWKKHKYLRKEGNRYIYEESDTNGKRPTSQRTGKSNRQVENENRHSSEMARAKRNGAKPVYDPRMAKSQKAIDADMVKWGLKPTKGVDTSDPNYVRDKAYLSKGTIGKGLQDVWDTAKGNKSVTKFLTDKSGNKVKGKDGKYRETVSTEKYNSKNKLLDQSHYARNAEASEQKRVEKARQEAVAKKAAAKKRLNDAKKNFKSTLISVKANVINKGASMIEKLIAKMKK